MSLPSRERGLKLYGYIGRPDCAKVAPLAGAWIEIACARISFCVNIKSLPSRERGLKSLVGQVIYNVHKSLPSRERGLKFPGGKEFINSGQVAPLAGAWIEIFIVSSDIPKSRSLPSRERGLK